MKRLFNFQLLKSKKKLKKKLLKERQRLFKQQLPKSKKKLLKERQRLFNQ